MFIILQSMALLGNGGSGKINAIVAAPWSYDYARPFCADSRKTTICVRAR